MKGLYGSIGHALNKSNSNAAVPNIPPSFHSKVRPESKGYALVY